MSKIILNVVMSLDLEMPTTICEPFIVTRGGTNFITIISPKSVLFFDCDDGSITFSETCEYLRSNFKFVRFLAKGESFTYTK